LGEGENCRLRHSLARLHRKTLCYSKSVEMLEVSVRLLIYYLKHHEIPALSQIILYCATPTRSIDWVQDYSRSGYSVNLLDEYT